MKVSYVNLDANTFGDALNSDNHTVEIEVPQVSTPGVGHYVMKTMKFPMRKKGQNIE